MRQRGITLLEVVIVIGLAAALLSALFALYSGYVRLHSYNAAVLRAAGSATDATDDMQKYVTQAIQISSSVTINGAPYTSSASSLALQLPSIDSSGNSILNTYDYVVYFLSGTNLYRVLSPNAASSRVASAKKLSDSIISLSFTYDATPPSATYVSIDIRTSAQATRTTVTNRLVQKLYVRNQ